MVSDYAAKEEKRLANLKKYKGQAYVIQGYQDPVSFAAYEIKEHIPQATLLFIKQSGHMPWFEKEPVQKQFFECKAIAKFDCPYYELKYGDITELQDWEDILENPCCACYPDGVGTNNISLSDINGEIKKCPPTGC